MVVLARYPVRRGNE